MNNLENMSPTENNKENEESVVEKEPSVTESFEEQEAKQAELQKAISQDKSMADLQTMKLRKDLEQERTETKENEAEARSARLQDYTEKGFEVLIKDLESQISGPLGWMNPKKEIKEKIANLQTLKAKAGKDYIASWDNLMTASKFNRKGKVNKALEQLEADVLKPGDLDNYKDRLDGLKNQIKATEVKLSGD